MTTAQGIYLAGIAVTILMLVFARKRSRQLVTGSTASLLTFLLFSAVWPLLWTTAFVIALVVNRRARNDESE